MSQSCKACKALDAKAKNYNIVSYMNQKVIHIENLIEIPSKSKTYNYLKTL